MFLTREWELVLLGSSYRLYVVCIFQISTGEVIMSYPYFSLSTQARKPTYPTPTPLATHSCLGWHLGRMNFTFNWKELCVCAYMYVVRYYKTVLCSETFWLLPWTPCLLWFSSITGIWALFWGSLQILQGLSKDNIWNTVTFRTCFTLTV